jgi:hypothetical protein
LSLYYLHLLYAARVRHSTRLSVQSVGVVIDDEAASCWESSIPLMARSSPVAFIDKVSLHATCSTRVFFSRLLLDLELGRVLQHLIVFYHYVEVKGIGRNEGGHLHFLVVT